MLRLMQLKKLMCYSPIGNICLHRSRSFLAVVAGYRVMCKLDGFSQALVAFMISSGQNTARWRNFASFQYLLSIVAEWGRISVSGC